MFLKNTVCSNLPSVMLSMPCCLQSLLLRKEGSAQHFSVFQWSFQALWLQFLDSCTLPLLLLVLLLNLFHFSPVLVVLSPSCFYSAWLVRAAAAPAAAAPAAARRHRRRSSSRSAPGPAVAPPRPPPPPLQPPPGD